MWQTIIGGLLAIAGGFIATLLQVKYSRKIKMSELVAEKTVTAMAEAYANTKEIISIIDFQIVGKTFHRIMEMDKWFFSNRLFLPRKFPNKFLTIRNGLIKLQELERGTEEQKGEILKLKERLKKIANEAIEEIYAEMNIKPIEIEKLENETQK